MPDEQVEPLDWENYAVLQATQALLGLISDDVDAVFVEARQGRVTLHFVGAEFRADASEDIEDAVFELDVLLEGRALVRAETHQSIPPDFSARPWRGVFRRRNVEVS